MFLPVWDDRYSHVTKGFREILMEGVEIGLKGILLRFYVFPTGPIVSQATPAVECYIWGVASLPTKLKKGPGCGSKHKTNWVKTGSVPSCIHFLISSYIISVT